MTEQTRPASDPGVPVPSTANIPTEALGGDGAAVDPAAERDIWTGRTHWKHFAGRLALWFGGNIAAFIFIAWIASASESVTGVAAALAMLLVFILSGVVVFTGIFVKILGRRYRLTSQRLFIERGIFSQTIDQTELIRIDDVRVVKTFVDRFLGLGSITLLSTDITDGRVVLDGIDAPEQVAESVRTHMRILRKNSLFVENL